jgi:signal peptidase I
VRVRIRPIALLFAIGLAGCQGAIVTNAGHAMEPAIQDGERLVVVRNVERLERGQIVVFRHPRDETQNFVKRIVGLPGEAIAIADSRVFIDGEEMDEPYVGTENRSAETLGPLAIPPEEYFVLGDNRRNSSDSRHWGTVRRELVWAQARR